MAPLHFHTEKPVLDQGRCSPRSPCASRWWESWRAVIWVVWGTVALLTCRKHRHLAQIRGDCRWGGRCGRKPKQKPGDSSRLEQLKVPSRTSLGEMGRNRRRCAPGLDLSAPASPLLRLESGLAAPSHPLQRDPRRDATLAASGLAHEEQRSRRTGQHRSSPPIPSRFSYFHPDRSQGWCIANRMPHCICAHSSSPTLAAR